jgi:hypothetical protein
MMVFFFSSLATSITRSEFYSKCKMWKGKPSSHRSLYVQLHFIIVVVRSYNLNSIRQIIHKKKQLPSVVFKNVGYQFKNKKLIAIAPHTTKSFCQAHTHTRYNLSNEPREGRFLQKLIFQRFFPTL